MTAVSLPTVQSVQSTLHLSTMDATFTWICPLEEFYTLEVVNPLMHTIKNICKLRDKQKTNAYALCLVSDQRWEVLMTTSGREITILGCDFKLRVFYSKSKDPIKFFRMLPAFNKPLTEEENLLTDPRCRYEKDLRENIAKLIETEFHFAPPPIACDQLDEKPIQKSHPIHLPSTEEATAESLLKELVCENEGLFLGHNHGDTEEISNLFKKIFPLLKSYGVKHLYFEIPALAFYQQFALFNRNQEVSRNLLEMQGLMKRLKESDVEHHKTFVEISLCAKLHGIEVWPIDLTFSNLSEISSYAIAVTYRNEIMKKNISYYSSQLGAGEKYLVFGGSAHHEIATDLSLPHIRIESEGEGFSIPMIDKEEMTTSSMSEKKTHQFQEALYKAFTQEQKEKIDKSHDVLLTIDSSETGFRLETVKKMV